MGQEKSTPWQRNRPLAKNALPAAVVPRRDRAKGNREERGGGHHAAIWTDLQLSIQRKLSDAGALEMRFYVRS